MTTMSNSQTTSIWTAPKLGKGSTIKKAILRVKSAAARFWENYRSGLENGHYYIPMP